MWADNDTSRDFLNFTGVSDTVAEIIVQAGGRPISIGISGAWGSGKSSMIKLVKASLDQRSEGKKSKFVFVEFNAWLYQGYDDARAALMDVIATKLQEEAEERQTGLDKTKDLLKRVNWLRVAKLGAGSAAALAMGLPPTGLVGEIYELGKKAVNATLGKDDIEAAGAKLTEAQDAAAGLLKDRPETSPPKEIQAIRDNFEEALQAMGATLVVLIDDLDRCLPETTISTLEAIRLFLFLQNTAFVIAADESMIRHAVRKHFDGVEDALVTNYFDKLIQVPIRVPPLGTQEVRAYLILLFVENSSLVEADKEIVRKAVCRQLSQTWRGARVDRTFIQSINPNLPADLLGRLDAADRLAPLMTSASQIAGNPRLIKRVLNALSIRMTISKTHGVGVDEAALAKILLFERCGAPAAYAQLTQAVTSDANGKPHFVKDWEDAAHAGSDLKLDAPWDDPFVREWLAIDPRVSEMDLRGILYVGREHAPLILPEDRLSSEAAELLAALLQHPDMAASLRDRLSKVPRAETAILMDRILSKAVQEQSWGTPPILEAALVIVASDPSQGNRLGAFLRDRPSSQVTPSLIPRIADQSWSRELFAYWQTTSVTGNVKRAITAQGKK